jgi:hypothetical protein
MKTAPITKLPHPFIMGLPKKSLEKQSGMLQRMEIKSKSKLPNKTKLAHVHTQTAYQLQTAGARESKRWLSFSEPATKRTPH